MTEELTTRKLVDITDEGAFERLATTILRRVDTRCASLGHPGINADGKTVKSPVDGIAFVSRANPPHMIVVHHTICDANALEGKWLRDPAKVKLRSKGGKPTQPAGDVIKTIAIVAEERKRTPNIRALLILTTNQEPGQELLRDVYAAGAAAAIEIDVWGRSRLADALDSEAWGQELRRQFLGIDQTLLSDGMLSDLSLESLRLHRPPDEEAAWVKRQLDTDIAEANGEQVIFVIAESGSGKSVACYKRLLANKMAGGFCLVLTDDLIAASASLEQAIEKSLRLLRPSLAPGCGSLAIRLADARRPLLILAEDINRSGRAAALVEKIARWQESKAPKDIAWQLLCPVWPHVLSSLTDQTRRQISKGAVTGSVFADD